MANPALKAALSKLLAKGEQAKDNQMRRAVAAKKAGPPAPMADECPECKVPLEEGHCPKCGYSKPAEDDDGVGAMLESAEG